MRQTLAFFEPIVTLFFVKVDLDPQVDEPVGCIA